MDDVFTEDVLDDSDDFLSPEQPLATMGEREVVEEGHVTAFTHLKKIPSFVEAARAPPAYRVSVIVIVDRPGPLLMQLSMHPSRKCVRLCGFDRDEDGDKGELEASRKLQPGDLLIDINGKSLEQKPFKEVLRIIRQEALAGVPRVLSFIRFSSTESENRYFGEGQSTLRNQCLVHNEASEDYGLFIRNLLDRESIDLEKLRGIAVRGLPAGARSLVWMVLLGYLPLKRKDWDSVLCKRRALYEVELKAEFKLPLDLEADVRRRDGVGEEMADNASRCLDSGEFTGGREEGSVPMEGGTESAGLTDSINMSCGPWEQDRELLETVEKDVIRTYPELAFFDSGVQLALTNILYIYAKLNPGVSYVQGMNELAGTLYYVIASGAPDEDWRARAEADTFYCFTALMAEMQDLFINRLDESSKGLQGTIESYELLLSQLDPHLHEELQRQGLEPTYYTVRWITTLFSREFDLSDTTRLWDSLLADGDKHEFLALMCLVMVSEQREAIFHADFSDNIKMLQSYPLKDVPHLLEIFYSIRADVRGNVKRVLPGRPGDIAGQSRAAGIYDQLAGMDRRAINNMISTSVNKIMITAGSSLKTVMDALDGEEITTGVNNGATDYIQEGFETSDDEEEDGEISGRDNFRWVSENSSDAVSRLQDGASTASRWAWQGVGNLVQMMSSVSEQLSKGVVQGSSAEDRTIAARR